MVELNPSRVIRRVRQRLELSQESLARVLNATKGAIQHWERGRNNPDLARLLALRESHGSFAGWLDAHHPP